MEGREQTMTAPDFADLILRLRSSGDVSRNEILEISNQLSKAEPAQRNTILYVLSLYSHYSDMGTVISFYGDLLLRAKLGLAISEEEVSTVRHDLQEELISSSNFSQSAKAYVSPAIDYDKLDTLISILGWHNDTSSAPLVEQFLDVRWGGRLMSAALIALCRRWGMVNKYRNRLLDLLLNTNPTYEEEARVTAIEVSGEYLVDSLDAELLSRLIHIFESNTESPFIRLRAYGALSEAMGYGWADLSWSHNLPLKNSDIMEAVNLSVVREAKRRLSIDESKAPSGEFRH